MVKVYSYARCSTLEQTKGDSISRQVKMAKDWCLKNDLELDESLSFSDLGKSAFKGTNVKEGNFGLILSLVDSGVIKAGDYLLIENFDRASRAAVLDAFAIFTKILNCGVRVVTLADEKIYDKDNINDIGNLLFSLIIMSRANEESVTKSKRIIASFEARVKNAHLKPISGKIPRWLKIENNKIVGIPENVEVVQRIYKMSLSGMGMHSIVNALNSEGVLSFLNAGWSLAAIQNILKSRAVIGEHTPTKMVDGKRTAITTLVDYFPKIISDEDFAAVQVALASRRFKGGEIGKKANLFTHLMKCKVCGGSVIRFSSNGLVYMVCDKGRRGLSKCGGSGWRYDDLVKRTLKLVSEMDLDRIGQNTKTEIEVLQAQIYLLESKVTDTTTKRDNILNALELGGEMESLILRLRNIEAELKDLEAQKTDLSKLLDEELSRVKNSRNTLESLSRFNSDMDLATGLELRSMLRQLVDKITVNIPKRKLNIYYKGEKVKYSFDSGKFIQFD